MDTDKIMQLLERHEGRSKYMYADQKRNVTCGVGHALFTKEEACDLPFFSAANLAQRAQIAKAWRTVRQTGEPDQSVYLQDSAIDYLLEMDLKLAILVAEEAFPQFDSYPDCAQEAIVDLSFNLGSFKDFPRFTAAVKSENWTVAAQECLRRGVAAQRNLDTQQLLLQANKRAVIA